MWTACARCRYERLSERYASDVTDAEFALIEPLLPPARRGGRRRTTDLRDVLNAIVYLVRTGCQWRMLPREFPPRSTVYGYFRRFWQEGVWHQIWMILLMEVREQAGKEASPTAGVVDSQSVKTTQAGGSRGYDAGKKINGRKRHLITDTLGLPLILAIHPAGIQDRDGLALACRWIKRQFPWLRRLFADGAYQGIVARAVPPRPGSGWRSSNARPMPWGSRSSPGAG